MNTPTIHTDLCIIGAGPVGLFAVFEAGLLKMRCHLIDALPQIGGQLSEIYPQKPIYDIPGTVRSTGRELVDALLAQAAPFKAQFHLGQQVTSIDQQADARWLAVSSGGQAFLCKTMVIAAGVGAFTPRKLAHLDLAPWEDKQVFYAPTESVAHQNIVIYGGGEEAVQAALAGLDQQAASLTLVYRRDKLDVEDKLLAAFNQSVKEGQIQFKVGQIQSLSQSHLSFASANEDTEQIAFDQLWVLQGLSPQLGPVVDWGLDMQKKQIKVNTENFATSVTGIFAVGDVNTYPGKRKLIVSGFHEATLAAYGVAELVYPGQKIALEYTTASPRLHKLLGVTDTSA